MASLMVDTTGIDAKLLKQLSRMYEAGISTRDISEQLGKDQTTVKRLHKLLSYAVVD